MQEVANWIMLAQTISDLKSVADSGAATVVFVCFLAIVFAMIGVAVWMLRKLPGLIHENHAVITSLTQRIGEMTRAQERTSEQLRRLEQQQQEHDRHLAYLASTVENISIIMAAALQGEKVDLKELLRSSLAPGSGLAEVRPPGRGYPSGGG